MLISCECEGMGAVGRLCLALVPETSHLTGTPCSSERHRMNVASATEIGAWVTTTGLAGASELDLLRGFCERLAAAGFPLARATVLIDTLHPVHEGRAFRWRRDPTDEPEVLEYGRTHADSAYAEQWRSSPFHPLWRMEEGVVLCRDTPIRPYGPLPRPAKPCLAHAESRRAMPSRVSNFDYFVWSV
jgi:hypothetical protein